MAFGTFDLLHPGHTHFLREARALGDYLVVVVARDATVKEIKGRLPARGEEARRATLEGLRIADRVRLGSKDDKYTVVREERPDIIALGYDQVALVDGLERMLPATTTVVRLSSYFPEKYKSSKLA